MIIETILTVDLHLNKWHRKLIIGLRFPEWCKNGYMVNNENTIDELRWKFAVFTEEKKLEEIYRFTQDQEFMMRWLGVASLGALFHRISDKEKAWECLHRLMQDKTGIVRMGVAKALGIAFPHIPDAKQALEDLYQLAKDKDINTRVYANYSLGRIFIFKATEAKSEKDFRKGLEKAICFFEITSKESTHFNLTQFCLPFYRSFYTIIFKNERTEAEVQKYLAEAKNAVGSSESKEKLLEAVENLAKALEEAQKARNFDEMKINLNAYRRYCEYAVDLLETTEGKAPRATKLIRKGLPIIDERLKGIIAEIQEKTKAFCRQVQGTPFEDLGKEVNRIGTNLIQIRDPIGLEKGFINLAMVLSSICVKMPENDRLEACKLLKKANDEPYIEDKLTLINMVLIKISSQLNAAKNIEAVDKKLDEIIHSITLGIREELVISVGAEFVGTGAKHEIHIPLQEINYHDLKRDLESIKGKTILKLTNLPTNLAAKVRAYLTRNKKDELLDYLS